jgi:LemA protein
MNYNNKAQEYNTFIRSFPTNMVAGMFSFERASLFEANERAEVAPIVDFSE